MRKLEIPSEGLTLPGVAVVSSNASIMAGYIYPGEGYWFADVGDLSPRVERKHPQIDVVLSHKLDFFGEARSKDALKFWLSTAGGSSVRALVLPEALGRGALRWFEQTDRRNKDEGRGIEHSGLGHIALDGSEYIMEREFTDGRSPALSSEVIIPWIVIDEASGTGSADSWAMMHARAYYGNTTVHYDENLGEAENVLAEALGSINPIDGSLDDTYKDRHRLGNWRVSVNLSSDDVSKATRFIVDAFSRTKVIQKPEDILYS